MRMSTISDVGKRQFRSRFVMGVPSSRRPWSRPSTTLASFSHASQWTFRFPSRSSLRDRPSFVRPPRFPILPAGSITYCVATASDIVLGFDSLHAVRRYFPFPLCRRGEAETGSSLCGHSTGHAGEVEEVNRRARNLLPQVVISHIPGCAMIWFGAAICLNAGRQGPSISLLAAPSNSALTLRIEPGLRTPPGTPHRGRGRGASIGVRCPMGRPRRVAGRSTGPSGSQ